VYLQIAAGLVDVDDALKRKDNQYPEVIAVGTKENLKFDEAFVLFEGKVVRCATILEAIDLAFKSFYIFKIEFPATCFGAWQFLDYAVFKMKTTCSVLSNVKELAAFVCND
jgi:hypothetical protein